MFVKTFMLTEEQKRKVGEMHGKILFWILEGRSIVYMAKQLKLSPREIEENIDQTLYTLRKQVGIKRYIQILFWK